MGVNQRGQITMSDDEVAAFIDQTRAATLATVGPTGHPHLVAMWYAVIDGDLCFETKAKAQKVVNLRRDDRVSVLLEQGETYDQLRGVEIEGRAVILDDEDLLWNVGVDMWQRYNGPYSEEVKPFVEAMVHNRVVIRVEAQRTRSWDHRKLGMPEMELGGTTAAYL